MFDQSQAAVAVKLDAAAIGTYDGQISFDTYDAEGDSFSFPVSE